MAIRPARRACDPGVDVNNAFKGTKKNLLGIGVDAVTPEQAVARVLAAACGRRNLTVSALAVHGVMTGANDAAHRHRLNALDLVVPDGQPVRWALNLLHGTRLAERVYGPVLMLRVCEEAARAGLPIYLYGSTPPVLRRLISSLQRRFPELLIVGSRPSQFRRLTPPEKQEVVAAIAASGAAITFVGLGCPRQEVWAYEYRNELPMPLLAVGAAFDFHAGMLPMAPPALQRLGLEWLFRLACEPKRLWRRYILLNPAYVALVALQATGLRTFDDGESASPPELSYG